MVCFLLEDLSFGNGVANSPKRDRAAAHDAQGTSLLAIFIVSPAGIQSI
jgi:hypothetical protein